MDQPTQIKEAFQKVKDDILTLKSEISNIKQELNEIQRSLLILISSLDRQTNRQTDQHINKQLEQESFNSTHNQTESPKNTSFRHTNTTEKSFSTHFSTDNYPFQSLKSQNFNISIGNKGVSTDRQTDQQTDTSTGNKGVSTHNKTENFHLPIQKTLIPVTSTIIEQLDTFKKELRLKFKRLTSQEMLVFSSIYQFEDHGFLVDYQLLSSKLNLSESSIRDYVQRIISKGVVLDKEKVNNKRIILHIPQDLKKLTTLDTLIKLREI